MCDDVKGLAEREMMEAKEGRKPAESKPLFKWISFMSRRSGGPGKHAMGWLVKLQAEHLPGVDEDVYAVLVDAERPTGRSVCYGGTLAFFNDGRVFSSSIEDARDLLEGVMLKGRLVALIHAESWARAVQYGWWTDEAGTVEVDSPFTQAEIDEANEAHTRRLEEQHASRTMRTPGLKECTRVELESAEDQALFEAAMCKRGYWVAYRDNSRIEWGAPERTDDEIRADIESAMREAVELRGTVDTRDEDPESAPFPGCVPCADCDAPTPWEDGGFCEDCLEANADEDDACAEYDATLHLGGGPGEDAEILQLEEAISVLRRMASARERLRALVTPIVKECTSVRMAGTGPDGIMVEVAFDGKRAQAGMAECRAELYGMLRELSELEGRVRQDVADASED